jgi:hypothetical protein
MEVWIVQFSNCDTYATDVFSTIEKAWQYVESYYKENNFLDIEAYRIIEKAYADCKKEGGNRFYNARITVSKKIVDKKVRK